MKTCFEGHDKVTFSCEKCPVCAAVEAADEKLAKVQDDLTNCEGTIHDLEGLLASFRGVAL